DDLDDDDITLPSLPAQSVPIIDEPEDTSLTDTAADLPLATPIIETEKQSSAANTIEGTVETTAKSAANTNTAASQSKTSIPTMPLQDHLGDSASVTSKNNDSSAIDKAKTELQQPTTAPEESQQSEQ